MAIEDELTRATDQIEAQQQHIHELENEVLSLTLRLDEQKETERDLRRALDARHLIWEQDQETIAALREALNVAYSALRSYQHGNSAPDLAERIADHVSALLFSRKEEG